MTDRFAKVQMARVKCDKTFQLKASLVSHQRNVHEESKEIECDQCDKTFATHKYLWDHKYQVHREVSFECDPCSKTFKTTSTLYRHKRSMHLGQQQQRKMKAKHSTTEKYHCEWRISKHTHL